MKPWTNDRPELYEECAWDGLAEQSDVLQKNRLLRALLSEDTSSVLDVGCGNGLLIDSLPAEWRVVGVDRAEAAMSRAKREVVIASVDALPFADEEFDAVVCSEVLEHLDDNTLKACVAEILRVAGRAVLITVPNRESVWAATTRCPNCGTLHNIYGHVRSFNRRELETLFAPFGPLTAYAECGVPAPILPTWADVMRGRIGRQTVPVEGASCPRCGFRQTPGSTPNVVDRLHARLYRRALEEGSTKPYWMVAMFERR